MGNYGFDDFRLGHMAQGFSGSAKAWFDDVYIDNTSARIELCTLSSWELIQSTGAHCEIQIPHTTWDDNSLEFTVNLGSFTQDDIDGGLLLFVIDENGVVSNGFAVTVDISPIIPGDFNGDETVNMMDLLLADTLQKLLLVGRNLFS